MQDIPQIITRIFEFNMPFFLGISIAILSKNSLVYGYFHQINFLWIFINNIGIIALLLYKFYQDENTPTMTYEVEKSENENTNTEVE